MGNDNVAYVLTACVDLNPVPVPVVIGNLYDRLGLWWQPGYPEQWQSGVRDWILFRLNGVPMFDPWPNFNIADSLLVAGACMLLYQSLFPGEAVDRDDRAPVTGEGPKSDP